MINIEQLKILMNRYGGENTPFLFGINFEMDRCFIYQNPLTCSDIYFSVNGVGNKNPISSKNYPYKGVITPHPISYNSYCDKFNSVVSSINRGDSFLTNLTLATKIDTTLTLEDIYNITKAKYKLYVPNEFVCFSPEIFVTIEDGLIKSHPMKGTIDAATNSAETTILNNTKELNEHSTIVDLIRNDINIVANNTKVNRFRYTELLRTSNGELLQVSSEIEGQLPPNYKTKLGNIITSLLPAGSISGAPKESTINIIKRVEGEPRGFYTGVFGYFDGDKLDCGVLIRYIEQRKDGLYFRSGGGITSNSKSLDEYNEIISKIYLPI